MSLKPRDTFGVWAPERSVHHPTVVLTHPEYREENGTVVVAVVNVSSIRTGIAYDKTTVLHPEDYPAAITHPSYAFYGMATFKPVQELADELKTSIPGRRTTYAYPLPPVSQALFDTLCDGVQDSDFTPEDVREYCFERHPGDGTVTVGPAETEKDQAG